ncbi:Na+/H+ antiporter subunit D [Breoghania sp. L-A4]|uniref:Na+/H+ antiporter subunit D n=1 Tax=Breoghania sp. L-A4 TaxID=2304600 RepID=UPI000E36023B|nr:Na+/H+ antiporter subunit D [Breoghania sp. L-A4]AXS39923.1 Na+/H+ antiporter subunit D [Breoghania sp. L-A4]
MAASSSAHAPDIAHAMITNPVAYGDWLVIAPIIITLLGGALCLMMRRNTDAQPRLAILALGLLVLSNIGLLARVLDHGAITMVMGRWLPPFGIAFTVDATGAILTLISSIVALAAAIYGIADSDTRSRRYGFYPFLMLLMTGVSGAFLTGDIFNLYVWFEVLLISSFGMLVLGNEKAQLDGAVKYAVLNLIATTLFLIATGYLYGLVGTLNMADIPGSMAALPESAPVATLAALYFTAFAMKAAAFPLNFWLPASYHTPRVAVSAVFAGLLTKVGVYALIRVMVMLLPAHRAEMSSLIAVVAVATMLLGVLGALAQRDLRRALGYLVISGIGSMMAGIAIGTGAAISGALFYAVHSMIVMTALYLASGMAARLGGSFDLDLLGGLYRKAPAFAAVFLILSLAVAGLPPFSGFWPKVILVNAALDTDHTVLAGVILATGLLTSIAVGRVWLFAFWRGGPRGTEDGESAEMAATVPVAGSAWLGLGILVALVVIIGVAPEPLMRITGAGAAGMIDPTAYIGSVFGGTH